MGKDDYFIAILKYAREEARNNTLDLGDALTYISNLYPEVGNDALGRACNEAIDQLNNAGSYALRMEAYFQLLEYEELQQARQASQDANLWARKAFDRATIAMWISAVLAGTAIIIQVAAIVMVLL